MNHERDAGHLPQPHALDALSGGHQQHPWMNDADVSAVEEGHAHNPNSVDVVKPGSESPWSDGFSLYTVPCSQDSEPPILPSFPTPKLSFWDRIQGKGRAKIGWGRSLKAIVMSSCECVPS